MGDLGGGGLVFNFPACVIYPKQRIRNPDIDLRGNSSRLTPNDSVNIGLATSITNAQNPPLWTNAIDRYTAFPPTDTVIFYNRPQSITEGSSIRPLRVWRKYPLLTPRILRACRAGGIPRTTFHQSPTNRKINVSDVRPSIACYNLITRQRQ